MIKGHSIAIYIANNRASLCNKQYIALYPGGGGGGGYSGYILVGVS